MKKPEVNKQKVGTFKTFNGTEITRVALSKAGVPQLGASLGFLTIGRKGSVRDQSKNGK